MRATARVIGVLFVLAFLLFLLTPLANRTGSAPPGFDAWSHVLSRVVRNGPANAEGTYAASYTRMHAARSGAETPILLVDAAGRELAMGEKLLAARFVREAAFHFRNVVAYHGTTPEAARARARLEECVRRSALDQIAPLSLVIHDGTRFLCPVRRESAAVTDQDQEDLKAARLEDVARRHPGTPLAFALFYEAAKGALGADAARLYREALDLVQVPALPLVRPGDGAHTAAGFVDDARQVLASKDRAAVFFPDSEFETAGALVSRRLYYEVEPGPVAASERRYKQKFIQDAQAVLGETPEIERAHVYWGNITPDRLGRYSAADGDLDDAYFRAAASSPFLKFTVPSILTREAHLPVKVEWANLDRIRLRFSKVEGLPASEAEVKAHLDSLRTASLPVAYETTVTPADDLRVPIRDVGTWRVTAEAAGLSCSFFAVRCDPKLEALIFPSETVVLTNLPGLSLHAAGKPLGTEQDGAIRVGAWRGKFCPAHEECCRGCESCAHHHPEGGAWSPSVQVFGSDGKTFFRARGAPEPHRMPAVHLQAAGPVLHVYADRPVYRAGDTLRFRGVYREPAKDFGRRERYDVVPGAKVVVSIRRDKETLFNRDYLTGEFGTFAGEFTLPLSTSRAEYSLHVDSHPATASAAFEVIDYRKSDFVITLESRRGTVAVKAGYAWGAPVEGATVRAFVKDKETSIKDGRVEAAPGDPVRVVLLRGDEELASKSIVHREVPAALSKESKETAAGADTTGSTVPSKAGAEGPAAAVPALRTAKKVYGDGETIEVEVSGKDGEALVVLGDVMAYEWRRVPIRGGRGVARFEPRGIHDPGATVFAVLDGAVERLPLEINTRRLRIDIVPDRPAARPGEDVGVTLRARPGAELSLAAVDEAVFMIREDESPELYGGFYSPRPAAMAYAVFDSFTGDPASCEAEKPPRDPRLKTAIRQRDVLVRTDSESLIYDTIGVGGGEGGVGRYGGRFGGRENLVARGGGTRATESAVLASLKRLAERQKTDGSWGPELSSTGFGEINGVGRASLALLGFLGAGYSHLSKDTYGPLHFGETVKKGLTYLMRMQGSDGGVGPLSGDSVLNHALATLALSEAYGMSATPLFKSPAESAFRFLHARQAGDGGWHRAGGGSGEAVMTGFAVMAMKSGQLSELEFGASAAVRASRFFRALTRADGTCPVDRTPGAPATQLSTAMAMLSIMFLDADKREPKLVGVQTLVNPLPDGNRPDFCTWYAVSLALFQYDGPDGPFWKRWNEPMKNVLIPLQNTEGFWSSSSSPADMICMTAVAQLTMEVYYRYANVFGAKGGGGPDEAEPRPLAPRPAIRIHFPDTALWIPDLVTDSKGEAKATLRMPDSITTIRLTSRGVTKDTAVGEGVGRIESKIPFFANLKTPAFFVEGDEAVIRAELFNYTGADVETDVTLTGEGFETIGEPARRAKVGTSCESVSWRVRIAPGSAARFRVATELDAVERLVPVKPRVAPRARSFRGPVAVVPPDEMPVDLVLRVTPKGSALSKILEALRFLNEYPHG